MKRIAYVLVPAAALLLSLFVIQLPLFGVGPGPAREVIPLIEVEGAKTFPTSARLLLTTVSLDRLNAFEVLGAWLDPAKQLVNERDLRPEGETDEEFKQATLSQMDESKIAAVVVVLEQLTDYPEERGPGLLVQDVLEDSPADGRLFPGDVLLRANGERVRGDAHLRRTIEETGEDGTVGLLVEAGGERRTVRVRPTTLPEEERAVIGVVLVENFPFDVTIDSGSIGGPSAGIMWAVGLYDVLTPGNLLDGRAVAGTGEIGLDGRVRGIGGIGQKILAAERGGADVFLLPKENLPATKGVETSVELVAVGTFGEAVRHFEESAA